MRTNTFRLDYLALELALTSHAMIAHNKTAIWRTLISVHHRPMEVQNLMGVREQREGIVLMKYIPIFRYDTFFYSFVIVDLEIVVYYVMLLRQNGQLYYNDMYEKL